MVNSKLLERLEINIVIKNMLRIVLECLLLQRTDGLQIINGIQSFLPLGHEFELPRGWTRLKVVAICLMAYMK